MKRVGGIRRRKRQNQKIRSQLMEKALRARQVLSDARLAASKIQQGIQGREWFIAWLLALTLLRAVYHVLREVDEKQPYFKGSINDWIKLSGSKDIHPPEFKILYEFINCERNKLVKQYETSAGQGVTVQGSRIAANAVVSAGGAFGDCIHEALDQVDIDKEEGNRSSNIKPIYGRQRISEAPEERAQTQWHYMINEGPYAGREQLKLLGEALEWWDRQLEHIERNAEEAAGE